MPERGWVGLLWTGMLSFPGVWLALNIADWSNTRIWPWWPDSVLFYFLTFSVLCLLALLVHHRWKQEKAQAAKLVRPPFGSVFKDKAKTLGEMKVSDLPEASVERGRKAVEKVLKTPIYYPLDSQGREIKPVAVRFMEDQARLKAEKEKWDREHPKEPTVVSDAPTVDRKMSDRITNVTTGHYADQDAQGIWHLFAINNEHLGRLIPMRGNGLAVELRTGMLSHQIVTNVPAGMKVLAAAAKRRR